MHATLRHNEVVEPCEKGKADAGEGGSWSVGYWSSC